MPSSFGQPTKAIPAQRAHTAVSSTHTSAEQGSSPFAPQPEDLYTYQQCTIMIVVQLRPQVADSHSRPVLLSVHNGTTNTEDVPLYRLLSCEDDLGGPFPPTIVSLLEALQRELPARKQRHEQRLIKKPTSGSTSTKTGQKASQVSAKDAGKPNKAVSPSASTLPVAPVSAPSSPLPKEGLTLGGLFDDL